MKDNRKILIVEDDPSVAESIEMLLCEHGYDVIGIAKSHDEFLDYIKNDRPELVLLDIDLEGEKDGIDALAQECCNDLSIIYLTGTSDPSTVKRATRTNPASYLVKPYNEQELMANIEVALNRKSLENEKTKNAMANFLNSSDGSLHSLLDQFAKYLKTIRKEKNITQVDVAEQLGINYRHYQNIEAGKINLRVETFLKIINFFKEI